MLMWDADGVASRVGPDADPLAAHLGRHTHTDGYYYVLVQDIFLSVLTTRIVGFNGL